MSKKIRVCILVILLFSYFPPIPTLANSVPPYCVEGSHLGGAEYLICVPDDWQGTLIVYAHGYVAFNEPIGIPWDQLYLPDGTSLPGIFTELGFAFATTSYSTNGLAVQEGIIEIIDLVDVFETLYPTPDTVLIGGVSEGGLITTLAVEQYPQVFDGGLSTCGPIGDFQKQINYFADFRVIFDFLFPSILPPDAVNIPLSVINNWETEYYPLIKEIPRSKPLLTKQLFKITGAPTDKYKSASVQQTIERILWYNVFATNDAIEKLGGQPYDNTDSFFTGILRLRTLNKNVARYSGDQAAIGTIKADYQTSGKLSIPLVTIHTTGDEVVPYWHQNLYRSKVKKNNDQALFTHIPVYRYGHCNFNVIEVLAGFAILLNKTNGQHIHGIEAILSTPYSQRIFTEITQRHLSK